MKNNNLPPHHIIPDWPTVGDNLGEPASTFPAALPTCAADALILINRAELNSFWPEGIRNFPPRDSWRELCECLAYCQPQPQLN